MNTELKLPRIGKGPAAARSRGDRVPAVKCRICGGRTYPGLDLGGQPIGEAVLTRAELRKQEILYPTQLFHCVDCGLAQLGHLVKATAVDKHRPFTGGTGETAEEAAEAGRLGAGAFAVAIGTNGGAVAEGLAAKGVQVAAVDPGEGANFGSEAAELLWKERGPADAIVAAGSVAALGGIDGVMQGVRRLLKPNGVLVCETRYWLDMVETGQYEEVVHGRGGYFGLRPLERLLARYEMDVFDARRSTRPGGWLRVFACAAGTRAVQGRVGEMAAAEEKARLYTQETNMEWARRTEQRRRQLQDRIYGLAREGKKVIGIGATAQAATVCNYCRLGPERIDYLTESNPLRIGRYLAGTRIPIVEEEKLFTDPRRADAGVVFGGNDGEETVARLRERGWRGEVIRP